MPAASNSTPISPAELSYLHTSLCHNPPIRPDARSATDFRPFRAETDILPACNGSSHLSLADGSEALVGVKADTQRTPPPHFADRGLHQEMNAKMRLDLDMDSKIHATTGQSIKEEGGSRSRGDASWVHLNVDISNVRDDDALLVFLSESLREPLLASSSTSGSDCSLADALVINTKWHWELTIDILLLSPFTTASGATTTGYPLPLLSLAIHLALRSTRLPKLKSQGEEDPSVNDDWEESEYLFPRQNSNPSITTTPNPHIPNPPITLLVIIIGPNILFDPSASELAVADSILAISVILNTNTNNNNKSTSTSTSPTILSVRTLDPPSRNTIKGIPPTTAAQQQQQNKDPDSNPTRSHLDDTSTAHHPDGLWRPRLGGVKREMVKRAVRAVVGGEHLDRHTHNSSSSSSNNRSGGGGGGGVAREVFEALDRFLI